MQDIFMPINNERGAAVIFTVMAIMVALVAGSVIMINMSTIEVDVSTNNKCSAQALYNAESGMSSMMKIIDRSLYEAELVKDGDSKFSAFTIDDSNATDEETIYTNAAFAKVSANITEKKMMRFDHSTSVPLPPSTAWPLPLYNNNFAPVTFDAEANWYYTHRARLRGNTLEFAAGYEGLAGGGKGSEVLFYRIITEGHGCGAANLTVNGEYRWVRR